MEVHIIHTPKSSSNVVTSAKFRCVRLNMLWTRALQNVIGFRIPLGELFGNLNTTGVSCDQPNNSRVPSMWKRPAVGTFGQYQRQTNVTIHLPDSNYATIWWRYTKQKDCVIRYSVHDSPDSKVHGANVGPAWGRQVSGGPHVGHVNLAIWIILEIVCKSYCFLMYYQY